MPSVLSCTSMWTMGRACRVGQRIACRRSSAAWLEATRSESHCHTLGPLEPPCREKGGGERWVVGGWRGVVRSVLAIGFWWGWREGGPGGRAGREGSSCPTYYLIPPRCMLGDHQRAPWCVTSVRSLFIASEASTGPARLLSWSLSSSCSSRASRRTSLLRCEIAFNSSLKSGVWSIAGGKWRRPSTVSAGSSRRASPEGLPMSTSGHSIPGRGHCPDHCPCSTRSRGQR